MQHLLDETSQRLPRLAAATIEIIAATGAPVTHRKLEAECDV
jgi:hypothetical protein